MKFGKWLLAILRNHTVEISVVVALLGLAPTPKASLLPADTRVAILVSSSMGTPMLRALGQFANTYQIPLVVSGLPVREVDGWMRVDLREIGPKLHELTKAHTSLAIDPTYWAHAHVATNAIALPALVVETPSAIEFFPGFTPYEGALCDAYERAQTPAVQTALQSLTQHNATNTCGRPHD